MMRKLLPLLILLFIPLRETEGQVLPFTHYTPDREINALPSAEVHKVYQDRLGYIWFAIYSSGLVRYDGVQMEVFNNADGLRDVTVWDLEEDPSGRLWVSSNAGLAVSEKPLQNYEAGEKVVFISEADGTQIIDLSVNHNRMDVDSKGWLWVGTENIGVVRYRFDENDLLQADTISTGNGGSEITVRALAARSDGSVWMSLLNEGIVRYKDGVRTNIYITGRDATTNVIFEDGGGDLWGGESNGILWKFDPETNSFPVFSDKLSSNISDIGTDTDENIWVSSEGSGIMQISMEEGKSDRSTQVFDRENGMLSEIAFSVFEDREKNLWIAQSGGVSKLRYNYKAFQNLTATALSGSLPVLPSPSINTVMPTPDFIEDSPCTIWAGSSEGGIACINRDFESEYIQREDGLTANWVNGLAYDESGRLWVGTSRGLNSITFRDAYPLPSAIDNKRRTIFGDPAAVSTYDATSVLAVVKTEMPAASGSDQKIRSIWFPAYQEVYAQVGEDLYTLDASWGLPAVIYHAAAFDGEGYLWLGTRDRGIYRSRVPVSAALLSDRENIEDRENFFKQWWSLENGAPTNQIENLLWVNKKMWVGTTAGLLALDAKSLEVIHNITTNEGLLANNATSVALSPVSQTLWVGTNTGLAEIDPETGNVLDNVTKADGLVDNEVWFYGSVQIDENGAVYFGSAKGVSVYRPREDLENSMPPMVRLTKATSDEVPGERNEFGFAYAALSFGSEQQIQYQTRLLGFNDEWSPLKREVRINYTNLPAYFFPKTYAFEARAVNESGVWSSVPLSYTFPVTPAWWLSWWAVMIYVMIFGISVYSVDRIQRKRLIHKEREAALLRETELKAETAIARSKAAEAQTKALEAENELKATELEKARELEKAYHELKDTQTKLIQAEKMASLGRLSAGIAHEIKNPLNFINNFAELSVEIVDDLQDAIKENDTDEIDFLTTNLSFNTRKIEEHGKRADSIVRSMMQHSRGVNMNFQETDLNDLISKFAELAYNGRKAKNPDIQVKLSTDMDPDLPKVNVVGQQIGQVVQNIIENAMDAVWAHKKESGADYEPHIEVATMKSGEQAKITISDNGPGIPEKAISKIFEPFYTTKPTGEGTGLGLSISYDIIAQNHSGTLRVFNKKEGGACFEIGLPLEQNSSE